MTARADTPDEAYSVPEQTVTHLVDLDEIVLTHILAKLHNPLPLALTCKTLLHALDSHPCRQEWFDRWHPVLTRPDSPAALAVLRWKPLAGYDIKHLSKFLANTVQHSSASRKQFAEQSGQASELSRSGQWLKLFKLFGPWPEHLLLLATAASPHSDLLSELLSAEDENLGSIASSGIAASQATASAPGSAANSGPIDQLTHNTAALHIRGAPAHGAGQKPNKRFRQPLPDVFQLHRQQHDKLQSALLSAAAAGQQQCLQLLLGQWLLLLSSQLTAWEPRNPTPQQIDLMVGLVEAAASGGDPQCLDTALLGVYAAVRPHIVTQAAPSHFCRRGRLQQQQQLVEEGNSIITDIQQRLDKQQLHAAVSECLQNHSSYCLVAAARSGSSTAVRTMLSFISSMQIKQQLPAALIAAGRRGHEEVLLLLLEQQEMSSKPLELAATDAAVHTWPLQTLDTLLTHMAKHYRIELLQLLHKPLLKALQNSSVLRQQQQRATVAAMLGVLKAEAVIERPELLGDVLLMLAQQGDAENVSWVLKVAPTVLVKLGAAAVAAALEGGYLHVAQLIMDAGGERPGAFKAVAKRGELVEAVRNKDIAAVEALLKECSLPNFWTTDTLAAEAIAVPADPLAIRSRTLCLLNLLRTAAAGGAPESVLLLKQLLQALPPEQSAPMTLAGKFYFVKQLTLFCFREGLVEELSAVSKSWRRTARASARVCIDLEDLVQLPEDEHLVPQIAMGNSFEVAAAVPGSVSAAIAVMQQYGSCDLLSAFVAHPFLGLSGPNSYLGVCARPSFPAQFMPYKKGLKLLLHELTKLDELPPSAKVRNTGWYKLMVRVIVESADAELLHAFLGFMKVHGESLLIHQWLVAPP